ncbi:MAG: response regulator [Verrucomicrobiales bacterium]|nr:response regulator [Verrucomicrobiales bacterium]
MDARTVLLVDDEPQVLSMIRLILKRAGLSVLTARSPREALALWTSHKQQIQVLVTDIELCAATTGCDLADELKKDKPDLKVILVSAYPDTDQKTDHVEFLQKPYDIRGLIETVKGHLFEPQAV